MKQRFCKFCQKDITADWPRLKKVCDDPVCREKLRQEHVVYMRKKDRVRRLKKKAANPRICAVCKKPLPATQHALKKTCPACKAKWEKEIKRKAAIRAKKKYDAEMKTAGKIPATDKQPPQKIYFPQPDDFCQADYEREQESLKKPNGKECTVCRRGLKGDQRIWCDKCKFAMQRKADVVRCDCGFEYDQAGGQKYNWSLIGE